MGTPLTCSMRCKYRRSEEHTSELQSLAYLVCRLLLEKKKRTDRSRGLRSPEGIRKRKGGCVRRWHLCVSTIVRRRVRRQSADAQLVALSFFFNDTATTEIYTLSLHDALPI